MTKAIKELYINLYNDKQFKKLENQVGIFHKYINNYYCDGNTFNLSIPELKEIELQNEFVNKLLNLNMDLYFKFGIRADSYGR